MAKARHLRLRKMEAARDRRRTVNANAAKEFLEEVLGDGHGFWAEKVNYTRREWQTMLMRRAAVEARRL